MPASTSAWCQARAVFTSPKSRTTSQLSKRGSSTWTGVCPGPGPRAPRSVEASPAGPPLSLLRRALGARAARPTSRSWGSSTGAGAPVSGVGAGGGLREGDHVADRLGAGEPLDDAVEPVGDAAVRRRAVAQRLEQEAEARLGFVGVDPQRGEDLAAAARRR